MLALPKSFAFKQLLPRLSELTEKVRDGASELKMSPEEVRYTHWRQALDSVPMEDAPFDANHVRQRAQEFQCALSTFNKPDVHDTIRENDWISIRELKTGLNTMASYVEKNGLDGTFQFVQSGQHQQYRPVLGSSGKSSACAGRNAIVFSRACSIQPSGYGEKVQHALARCPHRRHVPEPRVHPPSIERPVDGQRDSRQSHLTPRSNPPHP